MKISTIIRSALLTAICLLASKATSSAQNSFNLNVPNYSFESTYNFDNYYSNQNPTPYYYNNFVATEVFTGWEQIMPGGQQQRSGPFDTSAVPGAILDPNGHTYQSSGTYDGGSSVSLNPIATVANGGTGGATTIAKNAVYTLTLAIYAPSGANSTSFQLLATSQAADTHTYTWYPNAPINDFTPTTGPSPFPVITTDGLLVSSTAVAGGTTFATDPVTHLPVAGFEDFSISFDTLHGHNAGLLGDNLSIGINLGANAFVDNARLVEVAEVPEPSTWALMLAGAAGLFFFGRRKLVS